MYSTLVSYAIAQSNTVGTVCSGAPIAARNQSSSSFSNSSSVASIASRCVPIREQVAEWRRQQQLSDLREARAEASLNARLAELETLVELVCSHLLRDLAPTLHCWSELLLQAAGAPPPPLLSSPLLDFPLHVPASFRSARSRILCCSFPLRICSTVLYCFLLCFTFTSTVHYRGVHCLPNDAL